MASRIKAVLVANALSKHEMRSSAVGQRCDCRTRQKSGVATNLDGARSRVIAGKMSIDSWSAVKRVVSPAAAQTLCCINRKYALAL